MIIVTVIIFVKIQWQEQRTVLNMGRGSRQRDVVLHVLQEASNHPTVNEVYQAVRREIPRVSLGTVYRNLEKLSLAGNIPRLDKTGAQRRYAGNTMPHLHVCCRLCGRVGDVDAREAALPELGSVAGRHIDGFILEEYQVDLVGLCTVCRDQFRASSNEHGETSEVRRKAVDLSKQERHKERRTEGWLVSKLRKLRKT